MLDLLDVGYAYNGGKLNIESLKLSAVVIWGMMRIAKVAHLVCRITS